MNYCDVSVIIPNYMRTAQLKAAVNSVLCQTIRPREIIIIDDFSPMDCYFEIEQFMQNSLTQIEMKLLRNAKNCGANFSRNVGIYEAKGKYIAFLDSDDLWLPSKLEKQIFYIRKCSSALPVFSATGRYRTDETGTIIAKQFGGFTIGSSKIRSSNFIGTLSSVIVDTQIARNVGGFDVKLPACQDWDFFIRISEKTNFVGVGEPLCIYVDHQGSRITLNHRKRIIAHTQIYRRYVKCNAEVNRASIYRSIAEDMQSLNKKNKWAKKFFIKYLIEKNLNVGIFRNIFYLMLVLCFYLINTPNIKKNRYIRYRKSLITAMKGNAETLIKRDEEIIRKLINNTSN